MKRIVASLALAIGASVATADLGYLPPVRDPSLAPMVDDIESAYQNEQASRAATPGESEGKPSVQSPTAGRNPLSDSMMVGAGINTAFDSARNFVDWWDSANLLDQEADRHYEPDLNGEGAPDIPASLCGASADCNQCYFRVFNGVNNMRYNLEKLRIAGLATSDYVTKAYAFGDGLSGATGLAALQWQKERVDIGEKFDHFKDTYDRKYEVMMKNLKEVMDRWDACEAQYGERDWYARFGFLYYQFMRDKYKRSF